MSDTDDTDFLLLIPPDFFVVNSSESEDCDTKDSLFDRHKNEIDRIVVNDLISHVNELESRVCAIENTDSGTTTSSVNSLHTHSVKSSASVLNLKLRCDSSPKYSQMSSNNSGFQGSVDTVGHIPSNDSAYNSQSPRKVCNLSLPTTPINRFNKPLVGQCSELKSSVDHSDSSSTHQNGSRHENTCNKAVNSLNDSENTNRADLLTGQIDQKKLIDEIDQYFNQYFDGSSSIKISKMEDLPNSLKSLGHSSNTLPHDGNAKELLLSDLNGRQTDYYTTGKNLELPEVDKLLNEMERTQSEIERKLKVRESQFQSPVVVENFESAKAYQAGDTIGSVPDMGFGLREFYYNKKFNEGFRGPGPNRTKDDKIPVIEDPCIEKRVKNLDHHPRTIYSHSVSQSPDSKFSSQNDYKSATSSFVNSNGDNNGTRFRQKLNFNSALHSRPLSNAVKDNHEEYLSRITERPKVENVKYSGAIKQTHSMNTSSDKVCDDYSSEEKANDKPEGGKKKRMPSRRYYTKLTSYAPRGTDASSLTAFARPDEYEEKRGSMQNCGRTKIMSLSDLWPGDRVCNNESSPNQLLQKLDEERYRRQHCEQQIHDLQRRVLEDQEKLAVAVRVDKEKDRAIEQMWSGWQRLASHWHELEEQRHALTQQLDSQSAAFKAQSEEINSKIERWEKELSQALDLAADYKEKSEKIAQERDLLRHDMNNEVSDALNRLSAAEKENSKCMKENHVLLEKLAEVDIENDKDKQLISEYQEKLQDVEVKLNELEAEISVVREQKDTLSAMLKDEKGRNSVLEQKNTALQNTIDDYKRKEKALKDEVKGATERLEVARVELRALYQGQLEAVVKEKLKEFQGQLDAAEAALRAELHSREKEMAERAANECLKLTDCHRQEINRLEEKHLGEIKSLKNKLHEMERQKLDISMKLQREAGRRADMAQKLHGVMETHWRQALQIISNSPAAGGDYANKVAEEKRRKPWTSKDEKRLMEQQEDLKLELSKLMSNANGDDGSPGSDAPFNSDTGQATYRVPMSHSSSDHQSHHSQQNQLKRYIQMLLERAPGNPVNDSAVQNDSSLNSSTLNDSQASWAKLMNIDDGKQTIDNEKMDPAKLMRNSRLKQPWK